MMDDGESQSMCSAAERWTVITGSTGGIGAEIASQLLSREKAVVLVNRSREKSIAQRQVLQQRHPNATIEICTADLMDAAQITVVCEQLEQLPGRIEALYNNAGVLTSEHILSVQGYESQFAVNVLAPYQFTMGLLQKMARESDDDPAMVVNFSSSAISHPKFLDMGGLANPESVGGLLSTYAQTKLAATALAPALAPRLASENVLIRAIDPGATKTKMTTGPGTSGMPTVIRWLAPLFFAPAEKQAAKIIASAEPGALDGGSGIFVANKQQKPLPASIDDPVLQRDLLELLSECLAELQAIETAGGHGS